MIVKEDCNWNPAYDNISKEKNCDSSTNSNLLQTINNINNANDCNIKCSEEYTMTC